MADQKNYSDILEPMSEPKASQRVANYLGREALVKQMNQLTEIITHPEFVRAMNEVAKSRAEDRVPVALRLASPEALVQRGVPIPPEFRVTTRYFEEPDANLTGSIKLGGPSAGEAMRLGPTVCVSLGTPLVPLCLSVGQETGRASATAREGLGQ